MNVDVKYDEKYCFAFIRVFSASMKSQLLCHNVQQIDQTECWSTQSTKLKSLVEGDMPLWCSKWLAVMGDIYR